VPREGVKALRRSFGLRIAAAAGRLFRVGPTSVLLHAFPCCKPGGPCCLRPEERQDCCRLARVTSWLLATRQARGHWPPTEPVPQYADQSKCTWPQPNAYARCRRKALVGANAVPCIRTAASSFIRSMGKGAEGAPTSGSAVNDNADSDE